MSAEVSEFLFTQVSGNMAFLVMFLHNFSTNVTIISANEKNIFCNKTCLDCKLKCLKNIIL